MITIASLKDKRMNWLRAMERLIDSQETYVENYELISDCRIPGLASYGNGFLLCGLIAEIDPFADSHSYLLKLKFATGLPETIEAGKDGINFHPSDEIFSLMSLHLHARFYHRSTTTDDLTDHGIPTRTHARVVHFPIRFQKDFHVPELFKDHGNLTTINDFLKQVSLLPPRYHRDFIYSAYNYADGIRWIGVDSKIAYLKLIIAIEILAADKEEIQDDLNKELEAMKARISQTLINEVFGFQKQRRIKKSFIQFILNHKTNFLTAHSHKSKPDVTDENIESFLGAIYDSRSAYIHEGRPMAISNLSYHGSDVEMWVEKSISGTLETSEKEKIPTTAFFESLVRHCLLEYFERHIDTKLQKA